MDSVLPAAVLMFHSLNSEEKRVKHKNCAALNGREVYIIHALRKVLRSAEFCLTSTFVFLCVPLCLKKRDFNHWEWLVSVVKRSSLFLCLSLLNFYAYLVLFFVFCFPLQFTQKRKFCYHFLLFWFWAYFGWFSRTFPTEGHWNVAMNYTLWDLSVMAEGKISYE